MAERTFTGVVVTGNAAGRLIEMPSPYLDIVEWGRAPGAADPITPDGAMTELSLASIATMPKKTYKHFRLAVQTGEGHQRKVEFNYWVPKDWRMEDCPRLVIQALTDSLMEHSETR